jgi:hypothetical protein
MTGAGFEYLRNNASNLFLLPIHESTRFSQ